MPRARRPAPEAPDRAVARLPRFGRRATVGTALAFLVLAVLYTLPLATHLTDALPYAAVPPAGRETARLVQGDYLQFYYYLWLVRDRLLAGASILRDPYQFAVDGPRLNLPNTFLPLALAYVPLSAAGPRLGYNLLVLLSFPAAGLAAALLAHRYGVSRPAALVAGVVFACLPYRMGALLGGHPAGLGFFLAPLALWGLEGALAGSMAGGVWCGVALASLAVVEPHFFYFAALGLPLYLLARVGLTGAGRETTQAGGTRALAVAAGLAAGAAAVAVLARRGVAPGWPARLGLAGIVAAGAAGAWRCAAGVLDRARRERVIETAPVGPLALAALGAGTGAGFLVLLRHALLTRSVSGAGRTLHEVLLFSPLPADVVTRVNPAAGRAIYPGVLAMALAVAGTVAIWRRPPTGRTRVLVVFPLLLAGGLALSLGPRLPGLPLFDAAFRLVPFWNFVRQPAKFQLLAGLALAVLAAAGTDAILARLHGRRGVGLALAATIAALVATEYHPWRPTGVSLLPEAGGAHAAIRSLGPRALYLPLWPGDSAYSALYLYATTLTRVPMLNGYSAWVDRGYVTDVYRALETMNLGQLGESEYAALRRYRVRQVILDREAFPLKVSPFGPAFTLASLESSPYLDPEAGLEAAGARVFRVRETPRPGLPAAPRSPLGVYWEAESLNRETGVVEARPEASNGRAVGARAGQDRPGFLAFGPYRLLPRGPFRASFRLAGVGSRVDLEVTTAGGRRVLAIREARLDSGAFQELEVSFVMETTAPVEYRVRWHGDGWVAFDAVAVAFADVPEPAAVIEVEDLPHELIERPDPDASGARAGYADPAISPRDAVWSGPLRRYPAGRYRLWIRLKLDAPTTALIAWCGAQAASRGPVLGGRDVTGAEVGMPGRYVEAAVPFTLEQSTVLEFPCVYRGGTGVWFDRLRIEPAS